MTNYNYKVLITASGTGSRLKNLTKNNNKALIKINNKEILSYIIDSYPKGIKLIITLGYNGDKVKNYVMKTYPKRPITFVTVKNFSGPGSSLGLSMLRAAPHLHCPFIFHCNDTLVSDPIPSPEKFNWNGGSKGLDSRLYNSTSYSSFNTIEGKIKTIQKKGNKKYDYFHIGLVGIKNHQQFWQELHTAYKNNPHNSSLNDVVAINSMLKKDINFRLWEFPSWLDTGRPDVLKYAKTKLKNTKV